MTARPRIRPRRRVRNLTERRPRLRELPLNRLIPNILTVLALCAGLTSILYAFQGRWKFAVIAILVASVLDTLDGRVARLLHGTSRFGAELDSLSDFLSFGVAPAVLLFLWTLQGAHQAGWVVALLFAVCTALRLARFNTALDGDDGAGTVPGFFTGVPAPAAAGLVLLPMMLSFELGDSVMRLPMVNAPVAVAVAILMISRLPTFSFKGPRIPNRLVLPFLLAVGLVAALAATATWITVSALLVLYLLSIPFSIRQHARLAARTFPKGDDGEGPETMFVGLSREDTEDEPGDAGIRPNRR